MVEVAFWDHARRYFEKAAKLHRKSGRAHVALSDIRTLYRLERQMRMRETANWPMRLNRVAVST